jgi:hypothetical protein
MYTLIECWTCRRGVNSLVVCSKRADQNQLGLKLLFPRQPSTALVRYEALHAIWVGWIVAAQLQLCTIIGRPASSSVSNIPQLLDPLVATTGRRQLQPLRFFTTVRRSARVSCDHQCHKFVDLHSVPRQSAGNIALMHMRCMLSNKLLSAFWAAHGA